MSPQSAQGPTSRGDEHWLDEDSGDADETCTSGPAAPPPWPAPPPWHGGGYGQPRRPRPPRVLTFAAVAVVAAAIGAAMAVGIARWPASSPASAAGSAPTAGSSPVAPAPNTGNGNALPAPGIGGGSGVSEQLMLAGKVTAVSGTAITIHAGADAISAEITSATQFSGSVKSSRGIKIGDEVMLEVSVSDGRNVATGIQDPFAGAGALP